MANLWDPLDNIKESSDEFLNLARKREIRNILKSYVGFYDPFSELLQNAMDAVDERVRELQEKDYQRRIWIRVDLKDNQFSVTDNGIGFSKEKFKTFLCPNISFKDSEYSRGDKGVGATYLGYGFNNLQIGTKTSDFSLIAEIRGGRKWLDDMKGKVIRPSVSESTLIHEVFNDVDQGSTFTLTLEDPSTRPSDLAWVGAATAEQWKAVLCLKTPLGHIALFDNKSATLFSIEVVDKDGEVTSLEDEPAWYLYPDEVIKNCIEIDEIIAAQQKNIDKGKDSSKLPAKYRKLNGLWTVWSAQDIEKLLVGSEPDTIKLIKNHNVEAYGFFCYSTKVWDHFSDSLLNLRKGLRILKGGLQLATDGMPQGDLLIIPLKSNIGYQNQTHVLVHFSNAFPDLGRKGFQPELRSLAESISVSMVNHLKKWRRYLKKDTGVPPVIKDEAKLDEWIQGQRKHEQEHPLLINNPNFFIPVNEISIRSEPLSEQDVVVLFNHLVSGGVIRSIKLMASSTHNKYDGIFRFVVKNPIENYLYDDETNPLGVLEIVDAEEFTSQPYVLEYKFNLDALIQEFESGEKSEGDINLVIAWDIGDDWRRRYTVISLLIMDNMQHRPFHGITHAFLDDNTGEQRFFGIIIKDLIEYLHDSKVTELNQRKQFEEE